MKKVIIIGATSGIGKELALRYLKAGDMVGITGRRKHLLDELQQQYPQQVFAAAFDVTGNENIAHLEKLIEQLQGMDLFIYNSGYGEASRELNWAVDEKTILINVNGFAETTNYAFNFFVKQGHGQIVGISSIASYRGNSWAPAYSASKAFMSNYLEGIRVKAERMKKAIIVTDIQPGYIKTDMLLGSKLFWVATLEKASKQIFAAIELKKQRVQVTKRWTLIAWLLKRVPYWLYKKMG
jgi:short-subunit dehydrogenase